MSRTMRVLAAGMMVMAATGRTRVLKSRLSVDTTGDNLLRSGAWEPWEAGFEIRNGVIHCDNGSDAAVRRGAGQGVTLNQVIPRPIVATASSKARNVSGTRNADYSLYLDIIYQDGTPQWGQISAFSTGTHDWEKRRVLFVPRKPIARVNVYVLLRRHAGEAWFRDMSLHQIETPAGTLAFDGMPVQVHEPLPDEGFQVVDVAAERDVHAFDDGPVLDLSLTTERTEKDGVIYVDALLRNESTNDRAVTLYYTIRLPDREWWWLQDLRRKEKAEGLREYSYTNRFDAGANGRMSPYPLGAVSCASVGHALAVDLFTPVFSRLAYHAGTRELYVACDVGLTQEKPTAHLRFCRFSFSPDWGFRGALAELYAAYPEAFRGRVRRQGLWMPFAKISEVEGWQDFGFAFKEGNNETAWDDAHGIVTFRYTEPMTWWMRMPEDMPRTLSGALELARTLARREPDSANGRRARALLTSGFHDENGRFVAQLRDTPWCNGAVWSMNSMPGIGGEVTDFKLKWNPSVRQSLYGPERAGNLDGEYVDSSEGYVTAMLDFRRDHFAATDTPLTFSLDSRQPAVFRGLIATEYVRELARDVHGMGKLMMANSTPSRIWFLAPYLDVMGTETNWNPGGTWRPMSDEAMLYRRAMCGPKPYCFLQNTVFDEFPTEKVERYMKRSLAYGMFPGFFSHNASQGHYFTRPELYNRDRHLFKTYIPLCRTVAEAGWEPLTLATTDVEDVYVERFGQSILTVFNDSQEERQVTLTIAYDGIHHATDLLHSREIDLSPTREGYAAALTLAAEDVAVLRLHKDR